ncbi:UNVERIFIED_CONTAM: 4-hydroxyphenylacetaldehyde oxime monooxygenase [Sesamum radiatum]|uniref:4-hydroxyphenylacetaldehyde oxime monooxygenase n=1 Tax=Sesamum radiatum TaxID=300843 RepID=A0AAW2VRN8_SESRA
MQTPTKSSKASYNRQSAPTREVTSPGGSQEEYGPAMLLQLGCVPTFVVSSADFAKQVLKDHDISFCSRPRSPGPKQMFYGFLDVAFTPYGNHWRATRKIFVHHLLGPKKAESFSSERAVEIHHLVDYLSAASPNPVNLDDKIFDLADGVIGAVAFGKSYRGKQFEGQLLRDVIVEAMRMIDSFSAEDFFPNFFGRTIDLLTGHKARLDKCFHKLDGYLEMVLDEHLNRENTRKGDDDDLVDVLLGLSNEETGLPLTREHIKAIFMNTFLGGVDTSAIVIIWAMSELIRNPQTMQKAQAEIRTKLGVKTTLEPDDLGKLTFLKMIVKETLRLHPPVPLLLPRETRRMCQIHAENNTVYNISPQTRVLINAWAIGRDPNTWNKPNEFLPERFEGNEVDFRGQHFEFVPFGGGRRMCPGISNSIATIELTLANLLYWFDWEVAEGMKVEEIGSLEEEGGVTMHKRTKLTLVPINYAWL